MQVLKNYLFQDQSQRCQQLLSNAAHVIEVVIYVINLIVGLNHYTRVDVGQGAFGVGVTMQLVLAEIIFNAVKLY